jgi:predicted dehydrogenase
VTTRRSFLAAAAALPALGANDRLNIGFIGVGRRGGYLIDRVYAAGENLTITAICDTYEGYRLRAKDKVQSRENAAPKLYIDYRELLADPAIDAVVIATPEHLHHRMLLDALKAGKHVFIEKPLSHTIEEGAEMVEATRASGKVVQVGTQNRSSRLYREARRLLGEGIIGELHYVRAFWYRNFRNENPAWRYPIAPDANPRNTDWERFLGSAPKRPFDPRRYFQWRLYWDYSAGIQTDLLVHQTDIIHFVTGQTAPLSCVASGGVYRWKDPGDDREVPDTLSAIYEYPDGLHVNYTSYFGNDWFGYGEQFLGNEGTLEVLNRATLTFSPERFSGNPPDHIRSRQPMAMSLAGEDDASTNAHFRNFFDAIRGKEEVVAPVTAGHLGAVTGHLATLSFRSGRKVLWDEKSGKWRYA